ncbi:MAG: hypothetical protein IJT88_04660 [Kiritimatiellae bacterium]|nr:hypothetical protein [Kiritimatiellia bacterium]
MLYLGELNGSQQSEWQRAVEAEDTALLVHQLGLTLPPQPPPRISSAQVSASHTHM